jgi:pyridoxal phosphate enzyme (YggS family)
VSADIRSNLEAVRERITRACLRSKRSPDKVTLIAVSKTIAPEIVEQAFKLGIHDFGESRVQETQNKASFFARLQPRPVLHMIGHLQSNKVKAALNLFDLIHSVDSLKLAETINRQTDRIVPVLLEVNVAGEACKTGFTLQEVDSALTAISKLAKIEVHGLMTVAPIADNPEEGRPVFRKLRELKELYKLEHLSMGMTEDFEVAIEEGATLIRLGRAIFGEREPVK